MKKILILLILSLTALSCAQKSATQREITPASIPFSADSAYQFIAEQVAFGARVPNSEAHRACCQYLMQKLRAYGFMVELQQGQMPDYKGDMQQVCNVIGKAPQSPTEEAITHPLGGKGTSTILLCAHYDCRPWADAEQDELLRQQPVLGANDGASGVGVLLEVARQLSETMPKYAIEIVFFDAEDMGTPEFYTGEEHQNTWCLGSQLWSQNAKAQKTDYAFGILLDMVGSHDAVFPKEYFSCQYASQRVEQVWRAAAELGYGHLFREEYSYPITDDHYYINTLAGIPCIDIIHYDSRSGAFPHYWHTLHDDMHNISKETLEAVGKTVLYTICY